MLEKASEKLFNNVKPFSDVIKFHGHVCPGSALGLPGCPSWGYENYIQADLLM
jgi:hypothetical protein